MCSDFEIVMAARFGCRKRHSVPTNLSFCKLVSKWGCILVSFVTQLAQEEVCFVK